MDDEVEYETHEVDELMAWVSDLTLEQLFILKEEYENVFASNIETH